MMAWRITLSIVIVAALASLGGWWLREHWAIDRCLDAGGRWEDRGGYCVGAVSGPAQPDLIYCGGETDVATVERYFSELRRTVAESGSGARFNPFVDSRFWARNRTGPAVHFKLEEVGAVTPAYISERDWREISRRGARYLQNAGWRGCFLDRGKVWFEAGRGEGFHLKGIARDMPWMRPERGDVVP